MKTMSSRPDSGLNIFVRRTPLRSRDFWKYKIISSAVIFVLCFLMVILFTETRYVGFFFFLGGIIGMIFSLKALAGAVYNFVTYKTQFSDEEIKKVN